MIFSGAKELMNLYGFTKKEYQEEPVLLSDEEYHLLFHDRNVWVVYGRYKVTATLKTFPGLDCISGLPLYGA